MTRARDAADQINRVNSSAANATAITIDANENVGIGTSSPSAPLQVTQTPSDTVGNVGISLKDVNNAIEFGLRLDNASKDLMLDRYYSGAWYNHMSFDRSTGNVGIGTSSPSSYYSQDLVIAAPDEGGVTIVSGTTNTAYLMFADGTTGADRYRGQLAYDHNVNEMSFATDGSEAMRIKSSGAVTMPAQPAFSAINNTASQTNLAINAYHTVVFGGEIFDQGSDFASNTFTAPVTGRYQFNVQLRLYQIDTAAEYYQAYITTSNRGYEVGLVSPLFTSDPTYMTLSSSFLVDMDAADTAYVRFYQAGGSAQTDLQQACSIFSGYLVA